VNNGQRCDTLTAVGRIDEPGEKQMSSCIEALLCHSARTTIVTMRPTSRTARSRRGLHSVMLRRPSISGPNESGLVQQFKVVDLGHGVDFRRKVVPNAKAKDVTHHKTRAKPDVFDRIDVPSNLGIGGRKWLRAGTGTGTEIQRQCRASAMARCNASGSSASGTR